MFCWNCGADGADGKFCRYCGAPIVPPAAAEQTPRPAPRKKKGFGGLIVAAIIVVLLVIGGKFLLGRLSGLTASMASPAKYYQSVEKDNLDTWIAQTKNLASVTDGDGAEATLSLSFTDEGKALMGDDMDTSWLNSTTLDMRAAQNDAWSYSEGTFSINNAKIADFELLSALSGDRMLLRLPDFSNLYVQLPQDNDFLNVVSSSSVDLDALSAVLGRYGEIVIRHLDKVEKEKETVTVGSTTAEYDALVVTIDTETCAAISEEIADTARSDRDMERLIRSLAESEGEDPDAAYAEFLQELDEADAYNEETENEPVATMTLYVNKKGEICGRRCVSAEDPDTVNYYLTAWDGKNFETELRLTDEDGVYAITGSGVKDGDKISGDFAASSGDVQLWKMHVDKFDKKAAKEGKIDATFTLTPAKDYIDEGGKNPLLATFGYQIDLTVASGKLDAAVSLSSDAANLGTLQISSKKNSVSIPSVSDSEQADFETYISSIDTDQAEQTLKKAFRNAGVPEEYMD